MSNYHHIRQEAWMANMQLPELGLVSFTFGNVSAADHALGVFAIKPSGVPYAALSPANMVIADFDGKVVEGDLRPSSDTPTHAVLYQNWKVGGICHTHSRFATAWAQTGRCIPLYGTTHADHLTMPVPCAPPLSDEQVKGSYELETGKQIISCIRQDYKEVEMVLLANHGPFSWGVTAEKAVYHSAVLEYIAEMALLTEQILPGCRPMKDSLVEKHYRRKHGPDSYYGQ